MRTLVALVLIDAWMHCWHRANHELSFLWRLHRTHHTDRDLDASSAFRFHPGEVLLSGLLRLGVIGVTGVGMGHLLLYEAILIPVILVHHGNIRLPGLLERGLRWMIVTPGMHHLHHLRVPEETDSNYSSVFSWWNRVGGTFREPRSDTPVTFGLEG